MLNCAEVVELVVDYIEGALRPDVEAALEAHLRDCRYCRAFLREYRRVPEISREALAEAAPPQLESRLLEFLRTSLQPGDRDDP